MINILKQHVKQWFYDRLLRPVVDAFLEGIFSKPLSDSSAQASSGTASQTTTSRASREGPATAKAAFDSAAPQGPPKKAAKVEPVAAEQPKPSAEGSTAWDEILAAAKIDDPKEGKQATQAARGIYIGERPVKTEVSSKGFVVYERWENEDGNIHRKDGPAIVERDPFTGRVLLEEWYKDGKLHRENGPAVVHYDEDGPGIQHQRWWKDGEMLPMVSDLERLRSVFGHKPGEGRKLPGEITPADESRSQAALRVLQAQEAARPAPMGRGRARTLDL
jgi:hypothetical protein